MIPASIFRFLASQSLAVLLLCLAAGFALGRVRIGRLPANSTLATLIVSAAIGLLFRKFDLALPYSDSLRSLAFAFFSFALGFSAGPGFADTVRRDGPRAFLRFGSLSLCYAVLAALAAIAAALILGNAKTPGFSSSTTMRGLLAGALTQTTILDSSSKTDFYATLTYGVAYVIGLSAAIVFVQTLAPRFLGVTTHAAVKRHLDETGAALEKAVGFVLPTRAIQLRAYKVRPGTPLDGGTVAATEAVAPERFEIVAIYRGGNELSGLSQDTRILAGDVIVAVGDRRVLSDLPLDRVEETVDDRYLSTELALADIVLAGTTDSAAVIGDLSAHGLLLRAALRDGRPLPEFRLSTIQAGDVLQVAGLARSVEDFAKAHGYKRDDGAPSDLLSLTLAIGIAALLGAIALGGVSLGTGCCSLLLGLLCGCVNRRHPNVAHIPGAAIAFMRTLGLNVFIAALALGTAAKQVNPCGKALYEAAPPITAQFILGIVIAAAVVALVPLVGTLLFGRFILRFGPVPLLGGLCGGATCTPALNALEEETGSSVFTAAYTIPYVISNIILTLLGSILVSFIH